MQITSVMILRINIYACFIVHKWYIYLFSLLLIFRLISFIFFSKKNPREIQEIISSNLTRFYFFFCSKILFGKKDKETKHRINCVTIVIYQTVFPIIQAFFYIHVYSVQWSSVSGRNTPLLNFTHLY